MPLDAGVRKRIKHKGAWIELERCFGCEQHRYCTLHEEEKYNKYERQLREAIAEVAGDFARCSLEVNPGPQVDAAGGRCKKVEWNQSLFQILRRDDKTGQLMLDSTFRYPRLGAFEVWVVCGSTREEVFSKLQTQRWPNPQWLAQKIVKVVEDLGGWEQASGNQAIPMQTSAGSPSRVQALATKAPLALPSTENRDDLGKKPAVEELPKFGQSSAEASSTAAVLAAVLDKQSESEASQPASPKGDTLKSIQTSDTTDYDEGFEFESDGGEVPEPAQPQKAEHVAKEPATGEEDILAQPAPEVLPTKDAEQKSDGSEDYEPFEESSSSAVGETKTEVWVPPFTAGYPKPQEESKPSANVAAMAQFPEIKAKRFTVWFDEANTADANNEAAEKAEESEKASAAEAARKAKAAVEAAKAAAAAKAASEKEAMKKTTSDWEDDFEDDFEEDSANGKPPEKMHEGGDGKPTAAAEEAAKKAEEKRLAEEAAKAAAAAAAEEAAKEAEKKRLAEEVAKAAAEEAAKKAEEEKRRAAVAARAVVDDYDEGFEDDDDDNDEAAKKAEEERLAEEAAKAAAVAEEAARKAEEERLAEEAAKAAAAADEEAAVKAEEERLAEEAAKAAAVAEEAARKAEEERLAEEAAKAAAAADEEAAVKAEEERLAEEAAKAAAATTEEAAKKAEEERLAEEAAKEAAAAAAEEAAKKAEEEEEERLAEEAAKAAAAAEEAAKKAEEERLAAEAAKKAEEVGPLIAEQAAEAAAAVQEAAKRAEEERLSEESARADVDDYDDGFEYDDDDDDDMEARVDDEPLSPNSRRLSALDALAEAEDDLLADLNEFSSGDFPDEEGPMVEVEEPLVPVREEGEEDEDSYEFEYEYEAPRLGRQETILEEEDEDGIYEDDDFEEGDEDVDILAQHKAPYEEDLGQGKSPERPTSSSSFSTVPSTSDLRSGLSRPPSAGPSRPPSAGLSRPSSARPGAAGRMGPGAGMPLHPFLSEDEDEPDETESVGGSPALSVEGQEPELFSRSGAGSDELQSYGLQKLASPQQVSKPSAIFDGEYSEEFEDSDE